MKIRLEVENAIFNGITRGGRRGFFGHHQTPPHAIGRRKGAHAMRSDVHNTHIQVPSPANATQTSYSHFILTRCQTNTLPSLDEGWKALLAALLPIVLVHLGTGCLWTHRALPFVLSFLVERGCFPVWTQRHTEAHRGTQRHTEAHRGTQRHTEENGTSMRNNGTTRSTTAPAPPWVLCRTRWCGAWWCVVSREGVILSQNHQISQNK